jgi:DUF2959 family protein
MTHNETENPGHRSRLRSLALLAVGAGLAAAVAGCGTSANYNQADKTGDSMNRYRAQVIHLRTVVDDTLRSLNQVESSASSNPRKPYEQFSKNVSTVEKSVAKTRKLGQEMREKGEAYFSRWENQSSQVRSPEVKDLGDRRKAKLRATFDGIKKIADPLNARLDPWISDLKDLQTYLGNDLTTEGVVDAKKLFVKAQDDGEKVQNSLDELVAELNRIATEMTPAKIPEPSSQTAPKK